ncbi:MAG: Crp/Fnr family transcriptional regulator [Cytophagaceae bacterium]|nr:Crp/Fnr family transcriptional regulator [Cytophagaceae bacterium]
MDKLITIINQFANISEQAKNELFDIVSMKGFDKGSYIVEQGKTCKHLYFIKSGFLRGFYYQDGKEITSWFASENDTVTSMYSFISQKPSFETIEVLEDSTLFEISYNNLQLLFEKYPEFNLIGRLLTEKYYIELEERTISLQFQTATERYLKLLQQQPQLLQKASLGMIASYLGISQETLSRIRKKI